MLLRERNLSSLETQKKRFDMINYGFYESYLSVLLRKQEVLSTAMPRCANVSANAKTLMMNAIFMADKKHVNEIFNNFKSSFSCRCAFLAGLFYYENNYQDSNLRVNVFFLFRYFRFCFICFNSRYFAYFFLFFLFSSLLFSLFSLLLLLLLL